MSLPVLANMRFIKEKKRMKTNIDVGSIVKVKVGDMYENKREVINRRIIKEVVVCVQDVVGKNDLSVKFEYGHKRDISASLISYIC